MSDIIGKVIDIASPQAKEELNKLICNVLSPINNTIYAVRKSNFINFFIRWTGKCDKIFEPKKFEKMIEESDVATKIIEDASHTASETLQDLRARIIAQEYEKPNSISLRAFEEIKKLSAEEFLAFENEIAPYLATNALFLPYQKAKFIKLNNIYINMNIFTGYETDYIASKNHFTSKDLIKVRHVYTNKNEVIVKVEKLDKLDGKFLLINLFAMDIAKICEPKPWREGYVDEMKEFFKSIGLEDGDYEFKIDEQWFKQQKQ